MVQVAEPQIVPPVFDTMAPLEGNVPPNTEILWPACWFTMAPLTDGSIGIGNIDWEPHEIPAHGSAVVSLKLNDVR